MSKEKQKEIAYIAMEMIDEKERRKRAEDLFNEFYAKWEKEVEPTREIIYQIRIINELLRS